MRFGSKSALILTFALIAGLFTYEYFQLRSSRLERELQKGNVEQKRNVYLITATGLRPDHLSSYLYQSIQTPALDFLAYDGIRFLNAFTTAPESLPAHLSMLTGLYPFRKPSEQTLGYYTRYSDPNRPSLPLNMPQWFRKKGYATAAFLSDPELRVPALFTNLFEDVGLGDKELLPWEESYRASEVCRIAADWIQKNRDRPQFLLLNIHEPTLPYRPPAPFDRHYASYPYDGEIAALDEQIGLLMNSLKASGLFDRSVVIFTAPFASGPESTPRSLRDNTIHVPLFIAAPGILPVHKEYQNQTSVLDLFPTILSLLQMAPDGLSIDGIPLFQRNTEQEIGREFVMGETSIPQWFGLAPGYFVRAGSWKLVTGSPDLMFGMRNESGPEDNDASRKMAARMREELQKAGIGPSKMPTTLPFDPGSLLEQVLQDALGSPEDALQKLEAQDIPATPAVLALKSALLEKSGRLQQALELSGQAFQQAHSTELLPVLVRQRMKAFQFTEALALQERYVRSVSILSYYDDHMQAMIDYRLGEFQNAAREFTAAIEKNARFSEAWLYRGLSYERLGSVERARTDLARAIEIDPSSGVALREMAALLSANGKGEEAAGYLRKLLEQEPGDYSSMLQTAQLEADAGNIAEARKWCEEIILKSGDADLKLRAGKLLSVL